MEEERGGELEHPAMEEDQRSRGWSLGCAVCVCATGDGGSDRRPAMENSGDRNLDQGAVAAGVLEFGQYVTDY